MRQDRAAARHAGELMPGMASDLLSAVELAGPASTDPRAAAVSATLVRAFQDYVAGTVAAVDARRLVPLRRRARAIASAVAAIGAVIAAATLSPMMARGLRTLVHRPSLFEGAAISTAPLVGDVRVTYTYPAYTGLAPRTVEGSTGDVAAVKGTRVRIETHPLRAVAQGAAAARRDGQQGRDRRVAVGRRAGRRADVDRGRELPVLAAAAVRAPGARGAQPPSDRRARRAAAGRDPGPGRPAGAGDAAADRDRLFGQRRLRPRRRRAGLPRRRSPRAARRCCATAAARARSRGERCGIRRRRAWAAPSASPTGSRRAIATTCRASRGRVGKVGHVAHALRASSRTRTRAWRIGWSGSAICWRS